MRTEKRTSMLAAVYGIVVMSLIVAAIPLWLLAVIIDSARTIAGG